MQFWQVAILNRFVVDLDTCKKQQLCFILSFKMRYLSKIDHRKTLLTLDSRHPYLFTHKQWFNVCINLSTSNPSKIVTALTLKKIRTLKDHLKPYLDTCATTIDLLLPRPICFKPGVFPKGVARKHMLVLVMLHTCFILLCERIAMLHTFVFVNPVLNSISLRLLVRQLEL